MPTAVFDPGVLVSAIIAPSGTCGQLLETVVDGHCAMVVCPLLLYELEDVLQRPKSGRYLSIVQVHRYIEHVSSLAELRPDPIVLTGLTSDPDDDYLVALARASAVDYLVSGDAHLLELVGADPPVLAPRAFLEGLR